MEDKQEDAQRCPQLPQHAGTAAQTARAQPQTPQAGEPCESRVLMQAFNSTIIFPVLLRPCCACCSSAALIPTATDIWKCADSMEQPLPHSSGELGRAAALPGGLGTLQDAPGAPGSDVGWPLIFPPAHSGHRWCLLGTDSSFLGFPGCSPAPPGAPLLPAALPCP